MVRGAGIRWVIRLPPGRGIAAGWQMMLPAESGTLPHRPWATMPLVNGRTRKRSAAGGWSEAEVCAGELPLRGRPCMEENAAASGSCYWLGAPMRIGKGRRGRPWKAGIATSAGKGSNLPAGSTIGKQQMLTAALTGRMA